jgi:hypothetical protein
MQEIKSIILFLIEMIAKYFLALSATFLQFFATFFELAEGGSCLAEGYGADWHNKLAFSSHSKFRNQSLNLLYVEMSMIGLEAKLGKKK